MALTQFDPWAAAPAWAWDLRNQLALLSLKLETMEAKMAGDFSRLEAEVARNTSVDESAITLLSGLTEEIRKLREGADAATQAKIDALVNDLTARNDALAAAVSANTPGTPA